MLHIEGSTHQRPTKSKSLVKILLPIVVVIGVTMTLLLGGFLGYSWYMGQKEQEGQACRYDTSKENTQKKIDCYSI